MRCLKSSAHSTSAVLIVAFQATPLHFASAQQNKSHRGFPDGFKMHGAGNRNRTRNPLITNQLRYRCAMPAKKRNPLCHKLNKMRTT